MGGDVKIVFERPPVYDRIVKAIGEPPAGAIFTYGDTIYVPSGSTPPGDLVSHERVHRAQQYGIGIDKWWERYLVDVEFRVEQELMAYEQQMDYVRTGTRDKAKRGAALEHMARAMSGPMYGRIISYIDAWKEIGGYA